MLLLSILSLSFSTSTPEQQKTLPKKDFSDRLTQNGADTSLNADTTKKAVATMVLVPTTTSCSRIEQADDTSILKEQLFNLIKQLENEVNLEIKEKKPENFFKKGKICFSERGSEQSFAQAICNFGQAASQTKNEEVCKLSYLYLSILYIEKQNFKEALHKCKSLGLEQNAQLAQIKKSLKRIINKISESQITELEKIQRTDISIISQCEQDLVLRTRNEFDTARADGDTSYKADQRKNKSFRKFFFQ